MERADRTLTLKSYAVRVMVAEPDCGYLLGGEQPYDSRDDRRHDAEQPAQSFREIHMTARIKKIDHKLDDLAEKAKGGAEKVTEKIIDAANSVAHAATAKARQGTESVGEKLIDVGEKITKMAK